MKQYIKILASDLDMWRPRSLSFITPFFLLLCLVASSTGFCQTLPSTVSEEIARSIPSPLPLSPNAASLGRYGDYSVNLFTGLPDINIPIFEAKSGSLSMPITLRYMASGFRVKDQASWVGLGWTLDTGGQITRQVEGKRDEEYFYSNPIKEALHPCTDHSTIKDIALGFKDWFPDYFSYSLPGRTGKFLLGQAIGAQPHTSFLIPYQPINIKETFSGNKFTKFEITDEHGVISTFGSRNSETAIETTFHDGGSTQLNATTAWYLMDMYSSNSNDKIQCYYQSLGTTVNYGQTHYVVVTDNCRTSNLSSLPCPSLGPGDWTSSSYSTYTYASGLQYIDFENGRVEFVLGNARADEPQSKTLQEIKIYSLLSGTYSLVKSYFFNYSYFTKEGSPSTNLFLKLDELHVKDKNGVVVQKYKFAYHTNSFTRFYQYSRDHWGFYNGRNGSNLIPRQAIQVADGQGSGNTTIGGANKDPDVSYYKEGVLKRITFPTNGYTEFELEPHQYFDGSPTPKYAGGLRVSKITSVSGTESPPLVKSYVYGQLLNGAGKAAFNEVLLNNYNPSDQLVKQIVGAGDSRDYRVRTYFSNPSVNMSSLDGSTVYYPFVREYVGDRDNNSGYTDYEYDNGNPSMDGSIGLAHSTKTVQSKMFWQRGHLSKKTTFNNKGQKIATSEITYSTSQSAYKKIGWLACQFISYTGQLPTETGCVADGNNVDTNEFGYNSYTQNTASIVQSGSVETLFDPLDNTKRIITYSTSVLDPLTRMPNETRTSSGNSFEEVVVKYKYPNQYTPLSSAISGSTNYSTSVAINTLKNKHIYSLPVEKVTILQKTDGTNARVTSALFTVFKPNPANTSNIVAGEIFALEASNPVPLNTYAGTYVMGQNFLADSRFRSRVMFHNYDNNSRVKELSRTNDMKTVYLWGYNSSAPIAEITNTPTTNVFYTSFEEDPTAIQNDGKTGQRSKAGGFTLSLSGLTAGNYVLSYYFKDAQNKWQLQRDVVSVGTSFSKLLSGQIDEVRFHPVTSRMKTYTYDLLRGVDSITDENNQTTRYDYDAFGRLVNVKDNDSNILQNNFYHYATPN